MVCAPLAFGVTPFRLLIRICSVCAFYLRAIRETYGQYIEFLAALIVVLCVLYLALGRFDWFIDTLGFIGEFMPMTRSSAKTLG